MTRPTPHPDRRRLLQAGALVLLIGPPHLAHAGRVVAVRTVARTPSDAPLPVTAST